MLYIDVHTYDLMYTLSPSQYYSQSLSLMIAKHMYFLLFKALNLQGQALSRISKIV